MDRNDLEILLVEDNDVDAELTVRSLKKHNLSNKIHVAHDGVEAIEFLFNGKNIKPKVILLDLKLPKLNGVEVLQRIKASEETNKIPVVVLTSSQEEPDIKKCYELGVNSYIVKPVLFEDFTLAIAQLGMYWLILNKPPIN